jgi:nitrate reductase delta subunit
MRTSLRALAALLAYPAEDQHDALPEICDALAADPVLAPALPGLLALADHLEAGDLLDLQEEYVGQFDRTRSLCLNLFEHVHGDSRERGPAMVELLGIYAEAGLEPATGELPDYLPLLLEHAAVAPEAGIPLLANAAPLIDLLRARLAERNSPWAAVLAATLLVAGQQATAQVQPEPDQTLEELDAEWEEGQVLFGPGADPEAECGPEALAAKLRAARRAPNPNPRRPVIRYAAAQG